MEVDYPKLNDEELDNILELISLAKTYGYRNSKEIHIRSNREKEFNTFYMYFMKNFSHRIFDKHLHFRTIICISKKKPDICYIYVILKRTNLFTNLRANIVELIKKSNEHGFEKLLDFHISEMIDVIEKEFTKRSLSNKSKIF